MDDITYRKLRSQIVISVSSALALLVLSTVYGLSQISSISANLREIAEDYIPLTEISAEIRSNQLKQSVLVEKALRWSGGSVGEAENQRHLEDTVKEYLGIVNGVEKELIKGGKLVKNAIQKAHTEHMRESLHEIYRLWGNVEQKYREIDRYVRDVVELVQQGQQHEAHDLLKVIERGEGQFTNELKLFLLRVEGLTEQAASNAEDAEERAFRRLFILIGIAFSIIPVLLWQALSETKSLHRSGKLHE